MFSQGLLKQQARGRTTIRSAEVHTRRARSLLDAARAVGIRADHEQSLRLAAQHAGFAMNEAAACDDERAFRAAHALAHELGRELRSRFGCTIRFRRGAFEHGCPILLGHHRFGTSTETTHYLHCSICDADAEECTHLEGEMYDGVVCEWGRVELDADDDWPGPLVASPAEGVEARSYVHTVPMRSLGEHFGMPFSPVSLLSCDYCIRPCSGALDTSAQSLSEVLGSLRLHGDQEVPSASGPNPVADHHLDRRTEALHEFDLIPYELGAGFTLYSAISYTEQELHQWRRRLSFVLEALSGHPFHLPDRRRQDPSTLRTVAAGLLGMYQVPDVHRIHDGTQMTGDETLRRIATNLAGDPRAQAIAVWIALELDDAVPTVEGVERLVAELPDAPREDVAERWLALAGLSIASGNVEQTRDLLDAAASAGGAFSSPVAVVELARRNSEAIEGTWSRYVGYFEEELAPAAAWVLVHYASRSGDRQPDLQVIAHRLVRQFVDARGDDPLALALCASNVAAVHAFFGRPILSAQHELAVLDLVPDSPLAIGAARRLLGTALVVRDWETALDAASVILRLCEPSAAGFAAISMADVLIRANRRQAGIDLLRQVEQNGAKPERDLAEFELLRLAPEDHAPSASDMRNLAERVDDPILAARALLAASEIAVAQGDVRDAYLDLLASYEHGCNSGVGAYGPAGEALEQLLLRQGWTAEANNLRSHLDHMSRPRNPIFG